MTPSKPYDENTLSTFDTISLDQIKRFGLVARFDTKFIFHINRLPEVFNSLSGDYRVLPVNGMRAFRYRTLYFDTDDFYFYGQHHNQRVNRYKHNELLLNQLAGTTMPHVPNVYHVTVPITIKEESFCL